jgi:hypothetical protein
MFTRDLSLEDCILDLIDNSIDSLTRGRRINIQSEVLQTSNALTGEEPSRVEVSYSTTQFKIIDTCGGIPYREAVEEVFRFGHTGDAPRGNLGVYGVGLKRAIFKLGNDIKIESSSAEGTFLVEIDVHAWSQAEESLEDWSFPISKLENRHLSPENGTAILVKDLRREVKERFKDPTLESTLRKSIARTYPVFLNKYINVLVNGTPVERIDLPWGKSTDVQSALDTFQEGSVKVVLMATLAPRHMWRQEVAGWYVLCNGRMIVAADKSELTGWGVGLPAFHSKYRGFVGLALFLSDDALDLPWTTSKRGLNHEAITYRLARNRMTGLSKKIITFLNEMYPDDPPERLPEREIAEKVTPADYRTDIAVEGRRSFEVPRSKPKPTTKRAVFDIRIKDLERVRRVLRQPTMTASSAAKHAFRHFLTTECSE